MANNHWQNASESGTMTPSRLDPPFCAPRFPMRFSIGALLSVLSLANAVHGQDRAPKVDDVRFFEMRIRPLLADLQPMAQLSPRQWADLANWIQNGAQFPKSVALPKIDGAKHWAFQPMRMPAFPQVKDEAWV